jgi:hypothetical protein
MDILFQRITMAKICVSPSMFWVTTMVFAVAEVTTTVQEVGTTLRPTMTSSLSGVRSAFLSRDGIA